MADEPVAPDPAATAAPGEPGTGTAGWVHECERCGAAMREVHCKIICPVCGYTRDCSDP